MLSPPPSQTIPDDDEDPVLVDPGSGKIDADTGNGEVDPGSGKIGSVDTGSGKVDPGSGSGKKVDPGSGSGNVDPCSGSGKVDWGSGKVDSGSGEVDSGNGQVGSGKVDQGSGTFAEFRRRRQEARAMKKGNIGDNDGNDNDGTGTIGDEDNLSDFPELRDLQLALRARKREAVAAFDDDGNFTEFRRRPYGDNDESKGSCKVDPGSGSGKDAQDEVRQQQHEARMHNVRSKLKTWRHDMRFGTDITMADVIASDNDDDNKKGNGGKDAAAAVTIIPPSPQPPEGWEWSDTHGAWVCPQHESQLAE